jgi:soluble lytic murein transglycosylase
LQIHIVMQNARINQKGRAIVFEDRRKNLTVALLAPAVLIALLAFSPAGSRAPLPGERVELLTLRDRVERATILELVERHRQGDEACWLEHLTEVIHTEAKSAGVDPLLVAAIVARESSFRTRVTSHAGAVGLMQVRPFVGRAVAERRSIAWSGDDTLAEPRLNVRLGATYFSELVSRFSDDRELALAAYNRGPTRLSRQIRNGRFGSSRYVSRVIELYESLDRKRTKRLARRVG